VAHAHATPVVVDVHLRSGVAGLRAFGKAGLGPVALGRTWGDAGIWSRYASERAVISGRSDSPRRFAEGLSRVAGDRRHVIPYPGMEPTIDLVLEAAATTPGVVAPFPAEATRLLRQKSNLAALAADAGIAVPRTWFVASADELRRAPISFPCAVKSDDPVGSLTATCIVDGADALDRLLDRVAPEEPLVVQECLSGPLVCLGMVVDRTGAVVSRFQHLAYSTWPADAGPTARAVSVEPDHDLVARAAQLIRAAGYWGLVELDFLPGPRGHALIDANPRYYPALALATECGVNLPAAWHQVVIGAPPGIPGPYRVGMTYRWLEADVLAAIHGSPRLLFERQRHPKTGAMWSRTDPLPGVMLATSAATGWLARQLPRARGLTSGRRA
jgi:predicted ATP-grasp superfamily ATP-dependent carboligase